MRLLIDQPKSLIYHSRHDPSQFQTKKHDTHVSQYKGAQKMLSTKIVHINFQFRIWHSRRSIQYFPMIFVCAMEVT